MKRGKRRTKARSHVRQRHKNVDLEMATNISAPIAILGLIIGAFFLAESMTGNVIGLNSASASVLGAILLIIGLVAGFLWIRRH